jgi:hypothetical protein
MKLMMSVLVYCWVIFPMHLAIAANIDQCLQEQWTVSADTVTIGELKARCDKLRIKRSGDANTAAIALPDPKMAWSLLSRH